MLILAQGPMFIIINLATAGLGIAEMDFIKDSDFLRILIDVIFAPVDSIRRCIPDQPDLISIDLESVSCRKITMSEFSTEYEYSLPDQIMHNPKCSLRPNEIADLAANVNGDVPLYYDEVVNT